MDAIIKSRIDIDLKTNVERILAELGLTVSDAIRLTFKQIAARQGLPFDVKIPNAQTQSAMRDADAWVASVRANAVDVEPQSVDSLFASLSQAAQVVTVNPASKAGNQKPSQKSSLNRV